MKNLFLYCFLLLLFAACSRNADAQDSCLAHNKKKDWVIGYSAGEQMLLGSPGPASGKYAFTNTISGKTNIDDRWALDLEINVSVVKKEPVGNTVSITNEGMCKEYNVSVPVTIEYNFLPKQNKLRPYVGAGVQYSVYQESYNEYDFYEGVAKRVTSIKANTPYASFVITQGVTYDISPKIQIKESLHFLPQTGSQTNNSALGLSLGIGFKF